MTIYLEEVQKTTNAITFFAGCPDNVAARKRYRLFARHLHPDVNGGSSVYTDAFQKLQEFWGTYRSNRTSGGNASTSHITIKTKRHEYVVESTQERFDTNITASFVVAYDDGHKHATVQVAKAVTDSDLAHNAARKMGQLRRSVPKEYLPFYPEFIESFRLTQADGVHNGYALRPYPKEFFTLQEVLTRYPKGLDGRDIIWILKRLLVAVGNAHEQGIIHGNINPYSVLVSPDLHGVILKDWEYSVEKDAHLVAVWAKFQNWYPERILTKAKKVDEGLDIRLIANTMLSLANKTTLPVSLLTFLKREMIREVDGPKSASRLITHLGAVAEKSYGVPEYHTFLM